MSTPSGVQWLILFVPYQGHRFQRKRFERVEFGSLRGPDFDGAIGPLTHVFRINGCAFRDNGTVPHASLGMRQQRETDTQEWFSHVLIGKKDVMHVIKREPFRSRLRAIHPQAAEDERVSTSFRLLP